MLRKYLLAAFILLGVIGGLAAVKTLQIGKLIASAKVFTTPPESVAAFVVREEQWQGTLNAIGSISAVQGVMVTPDVPGMVREIAFESGATVAKSNLLVKLDTSSEEAQLRALEAQAELAQTNLVRVRSLRAENTISQAELDTAESTLKQAKANADAVRTTIEKKTIRAPFGGRLGIRLVNVGQYLEAGKPVVSLQSLAPVYVDFSLPQQELARLKTGMKVHLTTDAYPGRQFEGTLTAINPDLDASTRSVALQARLDNSDEALRPGMFARVEVLLPETQKVLVIPRTSILTAPYGDSVFIIERSINPTNRTEGLVVRQQFVRTGRPRGDFLSVETGLKAGERVASSGLFKLRNGVAVVENNEITPKPAENPRPSDS